MKKYIIVAALLFLTPCSVSAKDTWYSTEEQNRIDQQMGEMQSQIIDLKHLTAQLEARLNQTALDAKTEATEQVVRVVETREIVREPDNTRIEALEKRVGTLEKAVSFIQNQVLTAINNLIALFKKFL